MNTENVRGKRKISASVAERGCVEDQPQQRGLRRCSRISKRASPGHVAAADPAKPGHSRAPQVRALHKNQPAMPRASAVLCMTGVTGEACWGTVPSAKCR